MRYWVLNPDGRDARGPFEIADLKKLPGFSAESMVAPETATDASAWKAAKLHDQLRSLFVRPSVPPPLPIKPPPPKVLPVAAPSSRLGWLRESRIALAVLGVPALLTFAVMRGWIGNSSTAQVSSVSSPPSISQTTPASIPSSAATHPSRQRMKAREVRSKSARTESVSGLGGNDALGYRTISGEIGQEEFLRLLRALTGAVPNSDQSFLPQGLNFRPSPDTPVPPSGIVAAPGFHDHDDTDSSDCTISLGATPPAHIMPNSWVEDGARREFMVYWPDQVSDANPLNIAVVQANMPLPLRREIVLIAEVQGIAPIKNQFGEIAYYPSLKVIAAGMSNNGIYVPFDQRHPLMSHLSDTGVVTVDPEAVFMFDDKALQSELNSLSADIRLKFRAVLSTLGPARGIGCPWTKS